MKFIESKEEGKVDKSLTKVQKKRNEHSKQVNENLMEMKQKEGHICEAKNKGKRKKRKRRN